MEIYSAVKKRVDIWIWSRTTTSDYNFSPWSGYLFVLDFLVALTYCNIELNLILRQNQYHYSKQMCVQYKEDKLCFFFLVSLSWLLFVIILCNFILFSILCHWFINYSTLAGVCFEEETEALIRIAVWGQSMSVFSCPFS